MATLTPDINQVHPGGLVRKQVHALDQAFIAVAPAPTRQHRGDGKEEVINQPPAHQLAHHQRAGLAENRAVPLGPEQLQGAGHVNPLAS